MIPATNIKLIAADLDNTLMRTDKTVSAYTAGVLRRCREQGLSLAFATARSLAACRSLAGQLAPEYTVTCGGALVRRGGMTLAKRVLPRADADTAIRFCRQLPSAGRVLAEMANGRYLVSDETLHTSGDYAHNEHFDFSQPLPEDVLKLVIQIANAEERARALAYFSHLEAHNYTGSAWLFLAAPQATKWQGLLDVAADMGIGPEGMVAFGDDTADIDMLQHSGTGVAVANAIPEAKAAAGAVCPGCDEDGVARWLEEHLLS